MKCFVSWVTYEPKLRPTMQCQVGLYFLSNSFLMYAAMSFSMLYFSRAYGVWREAHTLVSAQPAARECLCGVLAKALVSYCGRRKCRGAAGGGGAIRAMARTLVDVLPSLPPPLRSPIPLIPDKPCRDVASARADPSPQGGARPASSGHPRLARREAPGGHAAACCALTCPLCAPVPLEAGVLASPCLGSAPTHGVL